VNEYALVDELPVGPIERLREVRVGCWQSCLQPLPGVRAKDVIAFRQRRRWWRRTPDTATGLIVDRRP